MENYTLLLQEEDTINLVELDTKNPTLFEKEKIEHQQELLKSLKDDYIASLRNEYNADEKLFEMVDELLSESEDQEKLIKILDSL